MAMSMTSHLNIGVRHIIPVFPFFAVMGAAAVSTFLNVERFKSWHLSRMSVGYLIASMALIAITTFPYYTIYFSPIAGGSENGWRVLSDSNVETGQDVKDLATFIKDHGENKVDGVFVGSGYIEYYGVENCDLPCKDNEDSDSAETEDTDNTDTKAEVAEGPEQPEEKPASYVAIGAFYLEEIDVTPEQKAIIDVYRSTQPEAVIGNAIFVFHKKPDGP
jgi:hypothetical protein